MCGIIGYVGSDGSDATAPDAIDVLLDGLSTLEYRGYDSAGVALANGELDVYKAEGELESLTSTLPTGSLRDPAVGIGHTRWSTHGPPTDTNAHPHTDADERVAIVHNGIIENYRTLRDELEADGVTFESETDTEVVPHLIASYLGSGDGDDRMGERDRGDRERAFRRAIDRLEGSYAIAAVFEGDETVYATRKESPLVLGLEGDSSGEAPERASGYFLASDVPAFIEHTDRVVYLEDEEFVRLDSSGWEVSDSDGNALEKAVQTVDWDADDTGKSGYDHYMLKEIHEQPSSLRQCLRGRVNELQGSVTLEELDAVVEQEFASPVQFVACGTSYHAALYAASLLQQEETPATATIASEFTTDRVPVNDGSLVVGITQSGETADTLRALREANRAGATTLAVTNTVGSSAARAADHALYIRAGPEIGVAATKTFASQQLALLLLSVALTGRSSHDDIQSLRRVPDQVQTILDTSSARAIAAELVDSQAFFFIGRGMHHPVALEGALKFKEITYEHAEGFAAGELKHGPLALVTEDTPVFAIVTGDGGTARKTISNIKEVEARDAPVVVVTDGVSDVERYADHVLRIPETDECSAAVLANVQLQLIAYWVANEMGRSIDKPRNLAKSVTVE
ncbi:glucosamine-fructose-6-phosphate aminotransferase [Halostagnicola larsenii XH-48]|uniref:Glutamine--fructose-6-phosphate aminotransferase [isomerizing] n=1 Tax=Halostagnicola larsenii XH-48 TaxID=797299 RepID=W0JLR1_9EURY|nr:glutamine--fructose-6-phosphate transaminase (isomerizing) [Halostagnicola larsenii]AHF99670.1 glucosamine-fructose-6-phosphate aminotransferase [Halostagnicola larsenii XH-48]